MTVWVKEPLSDEKCTVGHYRFIVKPVSSLCGIEKFLVAWISRRSCHKFGKFRTWVFQRYFQCMVISRRNSCHFQCKLAFADKSAVFYAGKLLCKRRMHGRVKHTLQGEFVILSRNRKILIRFDDVILVLVVKPVIIITEMKGIFQTICRNIVAFCVAAAYIPVLVGGQQSAVKILYNCV